MEKRINTIKANCTVNTKYNDKRKYGRALKFAFQTEAQRNLDFNNLEKIVNTMEGVEMKKNGKLEIDVKVNEINTTEKVAEIGWTNAEEELRWNLNNWADKAIRKYDAALLTFTEKLAQNAAYAIENYSADLINLETEKKTACQLRDAFENNYKNNVEGWKNALNEYKEKEKENLIANIGRKSSNPMTSVVTVLQAEAIKNLIGAFGPLAKF